MKGKLITSKVPVIIGNTGETYVLVDPRVGTALRAASPVMCASAASAEARRKRRFSMIHNTLGLVRPIDN